MPLFKQVNDQHIAPTEAILESYFARYWWDNPQHDWLGLDQQAFPVKCELSSNENIHRTVIAWFQITVLVRFGPVWFWLVTVSLIVWPRSLLLCPFHKKLRIWWKKSFGFCQTDNPRFSCIMYCYRYRQLTSKNLEVNSVPYISQQRRIP